uniref:uncharacterized protein LOC131128628 isoform X2 n=1 Tax=Doryrhamphus excisus TaxID=161450 RepID=UPI0025ADABCA|nr:uncharacterized protein LOC131128628 isoform X2 [Doryrhamphus excisus]
MFVTVLFGVCVDLMNHNGTVVNLETKRFTVDMASSLLAEREYYVLLQVCRNDDDGSQKYIPLLQSVSQSHQELTELLRKLCGQEGDKKDNAPRRGRINRKGPASHKEQGSKNVSEA